MNRYGSEDLGNVIAGDFIILLSQNEYQLHTFFTPIISCHIPHILLSLKLPMPQRSSNSNPPVTQAKNANAHPEVPDLVRKRKCHTKAEIKANNKAASEVKAAEEAKRLDGLKKIANLEMTIDEEDSNDIMPKPKKTTMPPSTNQQLCLPSPLQWQESQSQWTTYRAECPWWYWGQIPTRNWQPVQTHWHWHWRWRRVGTAKEEEGEGTGERSDQGCQQGDRAAYEESWGRSWDRNPGSQVSISFLISILTLDQSTFFYFSLNSHPEPLKKAMKSWASNVHVVQSAFMKSNAGWRPGSRAGSSKTVSEYTLVNNPITVSRKVNTSLKPRPICSISPTGLVFKMRMNYLAQSVMQRSLVPSKGVATWQVL